LKRNLIGLLLILVLIGGAATQTWAQDTAPEPTAEVTADATAEATPESLRPLSYGTPVTGEISGSTFEQQWPLSTASADRIQVRVTRNDGNLIPVISVLDSNGTSIIDGHPDYTYAQAEIGNYTLPSGGDYFIRVTRDGGETGETDGAYTLEVTPLGTASDNPNNETVIGEVQYETPVTGEITATRWLNLYTFTAAANDRIEVIATRTSGTVQPVVSVLDTNGTVLQTGYNDNAIADTNVFDLPGAGQYTIAVSRYNDQNGDTLGIYELTVHLLASGEDSPLMAEPQGEVTYDQTVNGVISAGQWYQDWSFTADAADMLSITVDRIDGDLYPEVVLLGASQQEIRRAYTDSTGAHATINRYALERGGSYTVRVTRYSGKSGESTGAYSMAVTLIGTGEDNETLTESLGELVLDEPVEGEITNALWQNVWTINGDEGDTIEVVVKRKAGTLVPTLEIRDINGQPITSGYFASTRDRAEITSYTFPSSGEFQIAVVRDLGQDGYTEGEYTLTVSTPK
jgi:hypothetical protein